MTLTVGLRISGDARGAKAALDDAAQGVARLDTATRRARPGADAAARSTAQVASENRRMGVEAQRAALGIGRTDQTLRALGQTAAVVGGPLGGVIGQISNLATGLSRAGLAGAGGVAIGGAILAGANAWKTYALTLDDVARAAGTTTREVSALATAASGRGIGTDEFAGGMRQFASHVYQAQRGMGSLADVFRANNVQARDFNDHLERAADLIRGATSDQQRLQLLQQMGLPATMQWVRLLSGGSVALREVKLEAERLGQVIDEELLYKARLADDWWQRTATSFGDTWRGAAAKAIAGIDGLLDRLRGLFIAAGTPPTEFLRSAMTGQSLLRSGTRLSAGTAGEFCDGVGMGREIGTVDKEEKKHDLQQQMPRLGLIGTLPAVTATTAAPRLSGEAGTRPAPAAPVDRSSENAVDRNHRRRAA